MRNLKESIQKSNSSKITVDPVMDERYGGKVLFQHKVDRLTEILKGTKLDLAKAKPKS